MLIVSVEFLHGTFRGDPEGIANTGKLLHGEWPPSVFRLFAALVAADGTRERCRVTDGSELLWFEQLPPPVIYADPHWLDNPLNPRYVVRHAKELANQTHQEYVARTGTLSRPGIRVALRQPRVLYRWDVEPPSVAIVEALRLRAARVGYLGTSDSPVRMRVAKQMPESDFPDLEFSPDEQGNISVGVPRTGDLRILDNMYDQWCEHGASIARQQYPALRHEERYRTNGKPTQDQYGEVVAWLRLGHSLSGRRISALTACFKDAVLSQHQKIHGEPPRILHGHGFRGRGYEIARYLALPDVGFEYSRGQILGLALWLPRTSDSITRQKARDAAYAIRRLVAPGIEVDVYPRDQAAERPFATNPRRWVRYSRIWTTAIPAIHERHCTLDLPELARWCLHAGLPEPVAFRSTRTPIVPGALDLAPVEVKRPGRPGIPYSHVELHFTEAVAGPVVIGSGRQRGFGLCLPVGNPSTTVK